MTLRHSIDRAEFDTRFNANAASPERRDAVGRFIQSELMAVIDEVFDEVERNAGKRPLALCLERLELDLGVFAYASYREQMPQRLRRELLRALDLARYDPSSQRREATDDAALYGFLRHGYLALPIESADGLDGLLRQALDSRPERLRRFFEQAARRDQLLLRLSAQFNPALVERVKGLLGMPGAPAARVESADDGPQPVLAGSKELRERLIRALENGEIDALWRRLAQGDPGQLANLLLDLGRQPVYRRRLARRLSARQFAELIRVIEPAAQAYLVGLSDRWPWLARAEGAAAGEPALLREYLLGYLLVERGTRFQLDEFAHSLLGQVAASSAARQPDFWRGLADRLEAATGTEALFGDLARAMLARVEALIDGGDAVSGLADDYRRYARLAAIFRPGAARRETAALPVDIDRLQQRSPWLLMRLLRELQAGGDHWQRALGDLAPALLERLNYALLALIGQTVAAEPSPGTAELAAAIRLHAGEAKDLRAYHAEILQRLVRGDLIDFDAIGRGETVSARSDSVAPSSTQIDRGASADDTDEAALSALGPRAGQMLQTAELLSTAGLALEPGLPPQRLQSIKRRFVETHARATGQLFNLSHFARGYLQALLAAAGERDARHFFSQLSQALVRNSLPPTRDLTRRLIEVVDAMAADTGAPAESRDSGIGEEGDAEGLPDDAVSDETVHVANAGLVLLAPWLPRLFDRLGFIEDGQFVDRKTAERAAHCTQYLVDGSVGNPEHLLVLNKILCGIEPGIPIRREIELSLGEKEILEDLLAAVTKHWKPLENTSIDGLRESFLQREGRFERRHDAWRLFVEARPFDMLLDQLPWSYSTIKFGWMKRIIYVEWR